MSSPARSTFRIDTAQLLPQGLARALYRPIRGLVERLSGIRALEGLHEKGHRAGGGVRGFCDAVLAELELTFDIDIPALTALASQGKPLILMGNHPLGGPEALALCAALEQACPGRYLLMANQVLQHIPALQPILVTVNPDWTQSPAKNAASLRTAYRHLRSGGVLALFPAGRVSGPSELDPQLTTDLPWTDQPLRMAEKAGASLATFHVTGQCSSTFLSIPTQWPHFRALRLIREMTHPAVRHAQFRFGPALLPSQFIRGGSTERTAKRISEALGTKTELRSQKNYTGHRLSPWLPHMMVSRQETQRALLTPGEIMQLPATDEIVMVAGAPPIRARKLPYFEDGNFTARVLPAASIVRPSVAGSHDWLGRVLCPPLPTFRTRNEDPEGDGGLGLKPELGEPPVRLPDDHAAEIAPDEEEDIAPEQDGHLRNVRRAVAMDQGNKDFLPDF